MISLSTSRERMDVAAIHAVLETSYWARGISRERVARSLDESLCFGLFEGERQIGFARVVTDRATFAYLCDVFVDEAHRGRGLGKRLIAAVRAHPDLADLRRFVLWTRDAHGLYAQFGFATLGEQPGLMGVIRPFGYAEPGEGRPEPGAASDVPGARSEAQPSEVTQVTRFDSAQPGEGRPEPGTASDAPGARSEAQPSEVNLKGASR